MSLGDSIYNNVILPAMLETCCGVAVITGISSFAVFNFSNSCFRIAASSSALKNFAAALTFFSITFSASKGP
jgi:hypothetical protein